MRHIVKRGMFSNKRAWYETMLLVPTPARFSRLSTIPFAIKVRLSPPLLLLSRSLAHPPSCPARAQITSSDPSTTTPIPPSSLNVYLIQRTHVQAQGLSHHHDMIVGQGVVEDDGPREGVELSREAGVVEGEGAVWERRCKGKVVLVSRSGVAARRIGRRWLTCVLRYRLRLWARLFALQTWP